MSISKITKDLQGQNKKFPPVHKWNPELCDGQEFFINRDGSNELLGQSSIIVMEVGM